MLKALALVCCLAVIAVAQYQYPYQYPHQQAFYKPPPQAYPPANYFRGYGDIDPDIPSQRILFSQLFNNPMFSAFVTTSTIFRTSSNIITCSLSTTACAGRRRRAVIQDLIEDEQFENIAPSKIHKIEPTVAVESIREGREADPQYFLPSPYDNQPYYRSGLEGSYPTGFDDNPSRNNYLPRQFSFSLRRTVYITSVVTISTTSTFVPSCSVPGTMMACPNMG